MIEQFSPMKPKKVDEIPIGEQYIYQQKIDGGNVIIDIELPTVNIIHARSLGSKIIWNNRTYRYPELVKEIREGIVLKDGTYVGELTVLDEQGVGRLWKFAQRSHLENTFQINRLSKYLPVVFYPHHILRENGELFFDVPYEDIWRMLQTIVKEGEHIATIPTFDRPDELLAQKGLIEGIVIKDRHSTYHRGKRGMGWYKKKFLKEKTVKFVNYETQDLGIKMFSDEGKPVHLAGDRVSIAIQQISDNGHVMCELEFYAETGKGYRDCSVKRILEA